MTEQELLIFDEEGNTLFIEDSVLNKIVSGEFCPDDQSEISLEFKLVMEGDFPVETI